MKKRPISPFVRVYRTCDCFQPALAGKKKKKAAFIKRTTAHGVLVDDSFMIHNVQISLKFTLCNMDRVCVWAASIRSLCGYRILV